jgi:hypothetical protein
MTKKEANDIVSRLSVLPQRLKNNLDPKIEFDPRIHIRLTCCDVGSLKLWVNSVYEDGFPNIQIVYDGNRKRDPRINRLVDGIAFDCGLKVKYDFNDCFVNYGACMGRNVVKDAQFKGNIFECVDYIENFYNNNKEELDKLKELNE